jgi:hypothetical protein
MNDDKVGNWTNGGSDTRDGGRVPQGSDTKELYEQQRAVRSNATNSAESHARRMLKPFPVKR